MKTIITIIAFLFIALGSITGQDKLVKKNGDILNIKVIEINTKYLVYQKLDDDEERTFTTPRNKLLQIIYESGEVYEFAKNDEQLSQDESEYDKIYVANGFFGPYIRSKNIKYKPDEIIRIFKEADNLTSVQLYQKARSQNSLSNLIGIPASFTLGWQLGNAITSSDINYTVLGVATLGSIISIAVGSKANNNMKKAAAEHNEIMGLSFGGTANGAGLVYSF